MQSRGAGMMSGTATFSINGSTGQTAKTMNAEELAKNNERSMSVKDCRIVFN